MCSMYNTKTCWPIPIRWYLCRFALPAATSTICNTHHTVSLFWTVHTAKKLHTGICTRSITCQYKFEELCNHLKTWKWKTSWKLPRSLSVHGPSFPLPPPERCKDKSVFARHFSLSVTAGADHHRSQHLSVQSGYYAIIRDGG
jgi:hypothetical protein